MRKKITFLGLLLSVFTFAASAYTINSAQPTGGTNFHSFADAVTFLGSNTITGPVTLDVVAGSGPYNEQVVFPVIAGSSATNTITVNGNNETLSFTSVDSNYATITLNGTDYIAINNLNIVANGTTYAFGVNIANDADFVTINGCNITVPSNTNSSTVSGIVATGSNTSLYTGGTTSNDIVISNNTINGGFYAVVFYAVAGNSTSNITIVNNVIKDAYNYGLYLSFLDNLMVKGNDVSNPSRTTFTTFYGIFVSKCNSPAVIANKIHDPFAGLPATNTSTQGIYVYFSSGSAAAPGIIANNVVYNMQGSGTQYGINVYTSDTINVFYNTVSLDYAASTAGTTYGLYCLNSKVVDFKNNIVKIARGGTGTKYAHYNFPGTTVYPMTASNNDYFVSSNGGTTNAIGRYGSAMTTLADWQTATGQDLNSRNIDPRFVSSSYLYPTIDSLDNLGTPITGFTSDNMGMLRNATTPDMGAFEFIGHPLPVVLKSFGVTPVDENALISWATATETNTKSFTIQRSANGKSFTDAGIVAAKGNGSIYSFTDRDFANYASNNAVYYRLVINDYNEKSLSATVVLNTGKSGNTVSVYPNPFTDKMVINAVATTETQAIIVLKDLFGRTVRSTSAQLSVGANAIQLNDLATLPTGMYELVIKMGGSVYQYKLSK